ncbi:MAG: PEP-CTERM sorting domain-containing protein [Sulfuricella sp.]
MKNSSIPYWQGALLVAALFAPSTPAFALGLASPLGWQGNGSKIIEVDLLNPPTYLTVLAQQTSPAVNTSTGTSHDDGIVRGSAQTRDYAGRGSISASGHDANTGYYRAGGYFKDELYFESKNNPAAIIEFVFNVNADAKLLADGGRADLSLNWTYYDGSAYTSLSYAPLLHITGNAGQGGAFNGTVTMAMNDANSANVLASGAYLPFTFGIWGDVANAEASWENMISLADVLVKDTAGNILASQDYILRSANGSIYFSAFENPPAAVPLPSSLLLFSFASAGIAGLRRRRTDKPLLVFIDAKPLFHPKA